MKKLFQNLTKLLILTILIFVIVNEVEAGSARRRGTAGAQELLIPVGSVGTALGGSYTAAISGIEAAYWNPAGVAVIDGNGEAMISRMNYIADIYVNYAAIMAKIGGSSAIGATLKSLDFGDIPVTTTSHPDGTGETFSPQFYTLGLLFSRVMTDRIRFGVKLNMLSEQVMRVSATGFALNAGVQYSTGPKGFKMGVVLRNLGGNMLFTGPDLEKKIVPPGTEPGTREEPWRIPLSEFELPTQMEIGVAYTVFNSNLMDLTLCGSFLNDNFAFDKYTFGAEFGLLNMFYLRGSQGIAENPDENTFMSHNEDFIWGTALGGGLKLALGSMKMKVDYTYRPTKFFDDNQWFSVRFEY